MASSSLVCSRMKLAVPLASSQSSYNATKVGRNHIQPLCSLNSRRRSHLNVQASCSGGTRLRSLEPSQFLNGDAGRLWNSLLLPKPSLKRKNGFTGPRAAADDVPAYKGFPPMNEKPRIHWRLLAILPYMLPVMEAWMYAETAYNFYAPLELYEFLTYPIVAVVQNLPQWFMFVYFFAAYLGIVRNNRFPHFLRFHVVNSMLLEIILQVLGTLNEWLPKGLYWGKLGGILWMMVSLSFILTVIECITAALRGMYADIPFLCDAAYLQIPYEA